MRLRYKFLIGIWLLALLAGAGYEIYSQIAPDPAKIGREIVYGLIIVFTGTIILIGIRGILKLRNRLFENR